MDIGITGLPLSGKSTVFFALTGGKGERAPSDKPRWGVVKVPDPRLEGLFRLFHPQKITPAEVRYADPPSGKALAPLASVDVLLGVIRAFPSQEVPHPLGGVDPDRDVKRLEEELALFDLEAVEKRLARLEVSWKVAKPGEREVISREQGLWKRMKEALEGGVPLREQPLTPQEAGLLEGFPLLTGKPLVLLLNIGEEELPRLAEIEGEGRRKHLRQGREVAALCGKLEMELAQLPEGDARELQAAWGLKELGRNRAIRFCYQGAGYITFFTFVSSEVRAWSIPRNTLAPRAAGKVHSDMERGFIRAEVISYGELEKCGSLAEARHRGLLRLEGKGYQVQDGDVITFLFKV